MWKRENDGMSLVNYKTFNLDRRPQVLLVGNGLAYSTGIPWHELIRKTARPDVDISQYEKLDEKGAFQGFYVPNTVLTLAVAETGDKERHDKYIEALDPSNPKYEEPAKKPDPEQAQAEIEHRKALLSLPFDAILTTNYTYEWEEMLHPGYAALSRDGKRRYSYVIDGRQDGKYLLHTFNRFGEDKPDIWHIHGELRRPGSLILSHDEYARLVYKVLDYNKSLRNAYSKNRDALKFQSWVDYLILGDVYILGLGMDFSEFDLWWLLGRRLREKAGCGSAVFYEREKEENTHKHRALHDAGVVVETCGSMIGKSGDYNAFYQNAIADIRKRLSAK